VTLQNWKRFLTVVASLLLISCASAKGSRPPKDIKVYTIQTKDDYCQPVQEWCRGKIGLVRKQAKEVKSFQSSDDFIAISPSDFQLIINSCPR
jgi:outer membrane biogenesis lipoprotein LolB